MRRPRRTRVTELDGREMNMRGEAAYIVELAAQGDARIVTLGPLLFFATETGDAWVLDPADHLALRLARDGDPLPADIVETQDSFTIPWNATYALEGDIFTVIESTGRGTAIVGYPVREIRRAIRRVNPRR